MASAYHCTECGDILSDEWVDKNCDLENIMTTGTIHCAECRRKGEPCPLCNGSGWVLQLPDRVMGATYPDGESGDEKEVTCPLCKGERRRQ